MPKFRIEPKYIIKAKDATVALAKFYKARAHHREDVYLSTIEIDEILDSDWLTPKQYRSNEEDE